MKDELNIKPLTDREIIEEIIRINVKHLGKGIKIILFGSRAKHTHTNHSDFDIAIEGEKEIPLDTLYILQEELNRLPTLKSFDIVDINAVSVDFKKLIKETGKVIYEGDRTSVK